jgi:hypothetical protein
MLHFAHSQIFWDCSSLSACETLPSGLPHALDKRASIDRHWRGRIHATAATATITNSLANATPDDHSVNLGFTLVGPNDDSIESFWSTSLLNYTLCDLTNQNDKLVAIWSIAKMVRDVLDEGYGEGLWENALEEQLAWRVDSGSRNTRTAELQAKYPSWSWASVKGPVVAHDRVVPIRCYMVTDHRGDAARFSVKSVEDRDRQPKLLEPMLALYGFIGRGTAKVSADRKSCTFNMPSSTDIAPNVSLKTYATPIFDTYLDESLPETGKYDFAILAATATPPDGTDLDTDPFENEQPHPPATVYSGTALLLTPHNAYLFRQRQALRSLLSRLFKQNPESARIPAFREKTLVEDVADLKALVTKLEKTERGFGRENEIHYKRMGALYFSNVDQGTWDLMCKGGKVKYWLD